MQTETPWKGRTIDSFIVAIMIASQFLNYTAQKYGIMGALTPIIIGDAVLLFISVLVNRKGKLKLNRELISLILIILIIYGISLITPNKPTIESIDLIAFCMIPLLIGAVACPDYELVLRMLMVFLCFAIPVFSTFFAKANHSLQYDAMSLGSSYAAIPVIMAGIVHFLYFRHGQNKLINLLYVVSLIFLIIFFPNSYRGPLIAVFITFIIVWISKGELRKSPKKLLVAIFLIIALVFIYFNLIEILYALQSFLSRFGISVATIEKTLLLSGDVSDGRADLYGTTLKLIGESPLWGHGISTYAYYVSGVDYPHNFILQLLFDGGLILFGSFLLVVLPKAFWTLKNKECQTYGKIPLLVLLIGTEVTRALLSGNMWRIIQFWLLIGIVINNYSKVFGESSDEINT